MLVRKEVLKSHRRDRKKGGGKMVKFNLDEKEKYYTPREIAERFGVSNTAVNTWLTQGKLEGFRVGNRWKVKADAVFKFIESSTEGR
jgi:excisionase family DNA binding protein